jgi:argininosuccinate synthase
VDQVQSAPPAPKKVCLAYSGGLDTSCIIPWLKETYDGCEVVAVAVDVGQPDDLSGVEAKALASGASTCHVIDAREEFVREYAYPTLRAGAIYERKYLLGTSMARPVIAKHQVEGRTPRRVRRARSRLHRQG